MLRHTLLGRLLDTLLDNRVAMHATPIHTGLIGFDAEMEAESCDRSCADSKNGATKQLPTSSTPSQPDHSG
jgi:hypothetical protein